MKVTVSAPGKIHFMGEHAVVYGRPALLAAVSLRTYVTVRPLAVRRQLSEPANSIEVVSREPDDYVRRIVSVVKKELKLVDVPPVRITIESQIPSGYHLGSSAAVAVGVVGALMYFTKKIWNPIRINEVAYEAEKVQHGNPSGGDNTTVTFGGFIWFRKELEFLKSIWQLPFRPAANLSHFFLINTGKPKETTGEMVAMVKARITSHEPRMQALFHENEKQARRIAVALKEGREEELVDALRIGERTLEKMGVVGKRVLPLIRSIEAIGGAAKILGGGGVKEGVGFLLCYAKSVLEIKRLCDEYRFTTQLVRLGEEGVRLEQK